MANEIRYREAMRVSGHGLLQVGGVVVVRCGLVNGGWRENAVLEDLPEPFEQD